MGSGKADIKRLKLEKKRLKTQVKLEKARARAGTEPGVSSSSEVKQAPTQVIVQPQAQEPKENVPWYKNPDWVRAIAAIASLVVAVVAIVLTFY